MKNGLLIVNKPENWTSRDVVNKCNHIFHTKKIGHTGTLDPIATGVLVICIGSYTKLVNVITDYDKKYIATVKLGLETDTMDITGEVLNTLDNISVTIDKLKEVLHNFPKTYEQTVPKYSAVKINGKKLYEYARKNKDVTLPTRNVNIYNLKLIGFTNDEFTFEAHVSKGTYIRSLISDICKELGVLGTMKSLKRVNQGRFKIDDALDIDNINYDTKLLTTSDLFDQEIIINQDEYKKVFNGNILNKDVNNGIYNILYNNEVIALYKFDNNIGKPVMLLSK